MNPFRALRRLFTEDYRNAAARADADRPPLQEASLELLWEEPALGVGVTQATDTQLAAINRADQLRSAKPGHFVPWRFSSCSFGSGITYPTWDVERDSGR